MEVFEYLVGESELATWLQDCAVPEFVRRCLMYFNVPEGLPVIEAGVQKQTVLPVLKTRECWILDKDPEALLRVTTQSPHVKPYCKDMMALPDDTPPFGAGQAGLVLWHERLWYYLEAYQRIENRPAAEGPAHMLACLLRLPAKGGVFLEIHPALNFELIQLPVLQATLKAIGREQANIHLIGALPQPQAYAVEFI